MRVRSSHGEFDQLMLFLSRLSGHLDGRLITEKRKYPDKPWLTLLALRILVVLSGDTPRSAHRTQASVAAVLGVTKGTMSTALRKLETKGLVDVIRHDKQRNHHVCITEAGRRAAHWAQVVVDDSIEDFLKELDKPRKAKLFAAIRSTNEALNEKTKKDREKASLDSVGKHDDRTRVRGLTPMRDALKGRAKLIR